MLKLVFLFFYIIVGIILIFSIIFKDYILFNFSNFVLFSYFVLILPFFDIIFNFFVKEVYVLLNKYSLEIQKYRELSQGIFGKISNFLYFVLFLFVGFSIQYIFFSGNFLFILCIIFGGYLIYNIGAIYFYYISCGLFLISIGFLIEEVSYFSILFSYFILVLISSIIISILEKLQITGKYLGKVVWKVVRSFCLQFWKNIKQDYDVIFYDVFFLFLIIFVASFYSLGLFEILIFLFTFVLFVYIVGKFFGLHLAYNISKKDIGENKKIFFFLLFVSGIIFYGYFSALQPNYMDVFKKEEIHPFEDPDLNFPENTENIFEAPQENNIASEEDIFQEKVFDISLFQDNLSVGSEGESVKNLQSFLNETGYYNFSFHGIYDENTQIAMRRFLISECNWPQTNQGILGPQARACIAEFLDKQTVGNN